MILVRRIARPMLAAPFVAGGIDAVRNPQTTAAVSGGATRGMARRVPGGQSLDPDAAVRVGGAVMATAAALLAAGRMPRVASVALLATTVPVLVEQARALKADDKTDPAELAERRVQFLGGLSGVGALLLAAADTAGKPSLGRRARHASAAAQRATHQARRELAHSAREATLNAKVAAAKAH